MSNLTLRVKVGETVLIGKDQRRWLLEEVPRRGHSAILRGPESQKVTLSDVRSVEIEPDVFVSIGIGDGTAKLVFRAPRAIAIVREELAL